MAVSERDLILNSLIQIVENGAFCHEMVREVLDKYDYLENNQKAFIKRVIEGTIENQMAIDEIIDRFSKLKCSKLKPMIRMILRMSIYQILWMDKVPDSAACNEAVKLAGKHGFRTLGGYVNGVLRNVSRNKATLNTDECEVCPEWLRTHFVTCYGEDTANAIMNDMQAEHPVTIRVRNKSFDAGCLVKAEEIPNAYYVPKGMSVSQIPGYENGDFTVQDINSQRVCLMADIKSGDKVLDVCASPGGKAIHAADLGADVTARDISEEKVRRIEENIERCQNSGNNIRIRAQVMDATKKDENSIEAFDVVLADVPCSGLGVIGRKKDIRFKTAKEDLDALSSIQKEILGTIYDYVKPGGKLVYSTCTINPTENEEQVEWILNNYPYELIEMKQYFPGKDIGDGFFMALLKRK